jgi:carbon-monoxide dehydrogenase large subunit
VEDRRFLTGRGHYVDDIKLLNMAFAYVVRSPHAHARILTIDKSAALMAPGVLAVLTGEDVIKASIAGLQCFKVIEWRSLSRGRYGPSGHGARAPRR